MPTLRARSVWDRVGARSGDPTCVAERARRSCAVGRMAEASAGKDSVTGHWEMMGIVLERAVSDVSRTDFRRTSSREFARRTGRGVLGNKAASGTAIIDELGAEHMRTGALIVYTSADSVFQIAAHEDVVPVPELYRACEIAYELVGEGLGVGRVIARPFVGAPGHFKRTANRHDYALPPSGETLLDRAEGRVAAGRRDRQDRGSVRRPRHHARAFTRRATTRAWISVERADGGGRSRASSSRTSSTSTRSTATATTSRATPPISSASTRGWRALLPRLRRRRSAGRHGRSRQRSDDAEHRSRARVRAAARRPARACARGVDLGTRRTFADLGQTLAEIFGVGPLAHGTSFLAGDRSAIA